MPSSTTRPAVLPGCCHARRCRRRRCPTSAGRRLLAPASRRAVRSRGCEAVGIEPSTSAWRLWLTVGACGHRRHSLGGVLVAVEPSTSSRRRGVALGRPGDRPGEGRRALARAAGSSLISNGYERGEVRDELSAVYREHAPRLLAETFVLGRPAHPSERRCRPDRGMRALRPRRGACCPGQWSTATHPATRTLPPTCSSPARRDQRCDRRIGGASRSAHHRAAARRPASADELQARGLSVDWRSGPFKVDARSE